MSILFLDSSYYLQFGLLNEKLEWVEFREIQNKKASSLLHGELYKLLNGHHLKAKEIKKIILGSGPGSYTGIRLAEGISQIFEWQGVEINSFYNFEIPYFSGKEAGAWCAKAFKNEIFVYEWNIDQHKSFFLKTEEFKTYLPEKGDLHHAHSVFLDRNLESTTKLLKDKSRDIFLKILKKSKHLSPYYFRPLEKEFKVVV